MIYGKTAFELLELLDDLVKLSKQTPNDQEFGTIIRRILNEN